MKVKVIGSKKHLPCGCAHDDIQILVWCEKCRAEHAEIHQRAREEHAARTALTGHEVGV